jgi:LacI family transcriptional regulator
MEKAKLSIQIIDVDLNRASGYQALKSLLSQGELPDALFAVNDPVAHGVYDAALELGLDIPGELAVAGVGDEEASAMLKPPLTSIKPPLEQMAEAAVVSLIEMIERDLITCNRQVFESQLIRRQST